MAHLVWVGGVGIESVGGGNECKNVRRAVHNGLAKRGGREKIPINPSFLVYFRMSVHPAVILHAMMYMYNPSVQNVAK